MAKTFDVSTARGMHSIGTSPTMAIVNTKFIYILLFSQSTELGNWQPVDLFYLARGTRATFSNYFIKF